MNKKFVYYIRCHQSTTNNSTSIPYAFPSVMMAKAEAEIRELREADPATSLDFREISEGAECAHGGRNRTWTVYRLEVIS